MKNSSNDLALHLNIYYIFLLTDYARTYISGLPWCNG